jgi:hypothetical protein
MTVDTSLFNAPSVGGSGGDWWPGREGSFIGELIGYAKGPTFVNKDKDGNDKDSPQVAWQFAIYKLDGSRVTYIPEAGPNEGQTIDAVKDGLTSMIISPKSKAGEWFGALLSREINFDKETREDLMNEALGKRGVVAMTKTEKGRIVIKTVSRLD